MMENRVAESHLLQWVFTNFEVTPQARVYKEDVFDAYVNVCVDAGTTPLAIDIFKRILQKVIPDARVFKRERKPSRTTKKNAAWSMRYIGNGSEFFEKSQTPSCDIMQDVVRSLTVLKPRDVFVSSTTEKRIRLCMFTEFLLDGLHVRKELTVYKTGRVKLVCGEKKLNPDDIGIPSRISKWRDLYLVTFFRFAVCQGYDSSEDSPGAVGLIHDMINHAAPVFYRMYSKACPGYLTYANDEDICDECFAESTKEPKEEQIPGQSTGEQLKSDKRNDDEDDEDDENDDMPGPSTSENPNLVPPIIIKYNPLLKVEVRKIPETRSMDDSDSENEQEPQKEKALDLRQNIHGPKQIIQNSKQTVLDVKQTIQTSEKTVHDPQQTIQDAKQTVHDPNQNVQEENTAAPDQPMDDVSDLDNDDFDDDPDSEIESGAQNLESVIDHIMEDCSNILQDEPSAVYLSAKKQDTQHSSQDFTKSTSEAISYKDTADPSSDIPIISNVTSLSIAEPVITRQPTNSTSLQAPVPVQPDPVSCESSATAAPAQKYTSAWYNVRQNENGSITFEYTPDLFGLHEVFLRINGELAKVAPFACMVTEDVGGNKYQYTPKWNIAVQAGTVQCSLVEAPAVPLPAADKSTPVSEEVPVIKQEPQSDDENHMFEADDPLADDSYPEEEKIDTRKSLNSKKAKKKSRGIRKSDISQGARASDSSKSNKRGRPCKIYPTRTTRSTRSRTQQEQESPIDEMIEAPTRPKKLKKNVKETKKTCKRLSVKLEDFPPPLDKIIKSQPTVIIERCKTTNAEDEEDLFRSFDERIESPPDPEKSEFTPNAEDEEDPFPSIDERIESPPDSEKSEFTKPNSPRLESDEDSGEPIDDGSESPPKPRRPKYYVKRRRPSTEGDADFVLDRKVELEDPFVGSRVTRNRRKSGGEALLALSGPERRWKKSLKYTRPDEVQIVTQGVLDPVLEPGASVESKQEDLDFESEIDETDIMRAQKKKERRLRRRKHAKKLENLRKKLPNKKELNNARKSLGDRTLDFWFPQKFLPKPDPVDSLTGQRRRKWQRKVRYICEEPSCGLGFSNIGLYKRHCRTHPKLRMKWKHLCDICGKSYDSNYKLEYHKSKHTDVRNCICEHPGCGKAFKTPMCLHNHMQCHGEPKFLCPVCGSRFRKVDAHKKHMMNMHPPDGVAPRPFPCRVAGCGKFYKTAWVRKMHESNHIIENLECVMCGLICKNKNSHIRHIKRCIVKRQRRGLPVPEDLLKKDENQPLQNESDFH